MPVSDARTPAIDAPVLARGDVVRCAIRKSIHRRRSNISTSIPKRGATTRLETKDGRWIDRHTGDSCAWAEGDYLGRVWFFRDITERKCAEAEIRHTRARDALTGLPTARCSWRRSMRIARAQRGGNGFAVLYLDLDHFKDVNDTLGHPVGDELLRPWRTGCGRCARPTWSPASAATSSRCC